MTEELQATHQILSLFEKSKSLGDQIFDNLSGIFINIDKAGKILRANKECSQFLQIQHEDILSAHASHLFSPQVWTEFESKLKTVAGGEKSSVEFEAPIELSGGGARDYLWQITSMPIFEKDRKAAAYTCVGRDISDVKGALARVVSLSKDLELTRMMQSLLLPAQPDLKTAQVEISAAYKSADIGSGDFWWYDFVDDDRLWVMVGDVTGHGPGPAMVTALISGCIEALRTAHKSGLLAADLSHVIKSIDARLCLLRERPYWMTLSALEFNFKANSARWWAAASPPIYCLPVDGVVEILSPSSSPLGLGDFSMASGELPFNKGQRILLMTDGVLESSNSNKYQFGMRGTKKFIEQSRHLPASGARDELLRRLDAWRGGVPADDDTTFVIIDRI